MTLYSISWSKLAKIMDYNDNILDNNFPLYSIIIHGLPARESTFKITTYLTNKMETTAHISTKGLTLKQ